MSAVDLKQSHNELADLTSEQAQCLLQWGLSLADTKLRLGFRVSQWVNGTPALEGAVGSAAITQDELGHARSLLGVLRNLPGAPAGMGAENDLEARDDYYNPRFLNTPWQSWYDVVAACITLDHGLHLIFEALRDSSYAPFAARAGKVLQEEQFHRVFGESWLARLAEDGGASRPGLQSALDRFWPVTYAWFGPPDDPTTTPLVAAGILTTDLASIRDKWLAQVGPLLKKYNLTTPSFSPDWAQWDGAYRDFVEKV